MTAEPGRPLLAANWKMNPLTAAAAVELAGGIAPRAREQADLVDVAVFPPFCWLPSVAGTLDGQDIGLGAQDCHWERSGAFTGEVSAAMLADLCGWVIVGHSERRAMFGDTDDVVARKAAAAQAAGLRVVVCVGEREDELEAGRTEEVVRGQLGAALSALDAGAAGRLVIAYEPVWAIGTGRSADPASAGATMAVVRDGLVEAFGAEVGGGVRVLYGGSANAGNVASYVALDTCQGCLVGGASLKVEEFSKMIDQVADVERSAAR